MPYSYSAQLPSQDAPLPPHIQSRHKWAMQLLMADGVARRLEEWPARETAPLYAGWFPILNPGTLRGQAAAFFYRLLTLPNSPSSTTSSQPSQHWPNWTLYASLYGYPFTLRTAPNIDPDFPPLSFLRTDFSVPLHIIWAQTGFPHVLAAAWLLSLYHPLLNMYGDLANVWYAFYQRQLLEWRLRRHWLQQHIPQAERAGLTLPEWLFHDSYDPWTASQTESIPDDWHWRVAALDGRVINTENWEQLRPAERLARTFTADWYARSWHPDSPYRRKYQLTGNRFPPEAPEALHLLQRAWEVDPRLGQLTGMLIEQRTILGFFAPLYKYFCAAKIDSLTAWLNSPEAAVVHADFHTAGLPARYEVF